MSYGIGHEIQIKDMINGWELSLGMPLFGVLRALDLGLVLLANLQIALLQYQ
jgi:hypothetical protein